MPKHGLRLDFPGAPATPHQVAGFEGEFTTDPRPLEECFYSADAGSEIRPITLEDAKKIHADKGIPLALVSNEKKE